METNIGFSAINMKATCRACLVISEDVGPMTICEIKTYKYLTNQNMLNELDLNLCIMCKWMLRRIIIFSEQCQMAYNLLCDTKQDTNSTTLLHKITSSHDFGRTGVENHYIGPGCDLADMTDKYEWTDDNYDDDLPLVMLKDGSESKRGKSKNSTSKDPVITQEDIKKEEILETKGNCNSTSRSKDSKVLREGFTSRMVQETDEYRVIKLTKEQVLQELSDRTKSDVYLRSPFKCDKCVKGFNFEDVLRSHMKKHTLENGTYKCDMCYQYCPTPVSMRGHIKSHTTRYQCKLCGQVRLSRQHLLEHHSITHTNAATAYKCEQCQFTTNKRTVIQRHVRSHAASEKHACHRCGKLFKTVESLRVHTVRHDKSSRVRCDSCDKRFIYPSLLHKHVAAVHERHDYYCVECDVKFKSPESLKLHFKKAKRHRDSSSYKYPCTQCEQRFMSSSSLAVHMSCAHGVMKEFSCAVCRRMYSSRAAVRAHAWRTHGVTRSATHHNNAKDRSQMCVDTKPFHRSSDSADQSERKHHLKHEILLSNGLDNVIQIAQDNQNIIASA